MRGPAFPSLLSLKPEAPATRRWVIDAIYADSVLRPAEPLPLEDGSTMLIAVLPAGQTPDGVQPSTAVVVPPQAATTRAQLSRRMHVRRRACCPAPGRAEAALSALSSSDRLAWILFGLGMLIYLFTRAWQITQFPIYFFTDEAANPLFARDLIEHGFRNAQGNLPSLSISKWRATDGGRCFRCISTPSARRCSANRWLSPDSPRYLSACSRRWQHL